MKKPKTTATASLRLEVEKLAQKGIEVVAIEAEVMTDGLALRKKVIRKGKPRRRQNTEFPLMLDSKIEPGLIFHMIKMVITYDKSDQLLPPPPKKTWQILLCLESYGGKATEEEILDECWDGNGTSKKLENEVNGAAQFLSDFGFPKTVSRKEGYVIWD